MPAPEPESMGASAVRPNKRSAGVLFPEHGVRAGMSMLGDMHKGGFAMNRVSRAAIGAGLLLGSLSFAVPSVGAQGASACQPEAALGPGGTVDLAHSLQPLGQVARVAAQNGLTSSLVHDALFNCSP